MDDAVLNELIGGLPEKCIALMEDIDAAFTGTVGAREDGKGGKSDSSSTISSRWAHCHDIHPPAD